MRKFRRRPADRQDELAALGAGLAAGVALGAVTWYLARIWLRREPLPSGRAPEPRSRAGRAVPGSASESVPEGASES